MLAIVEDQNTKPFGEIIAHLIQEMENHLQVISMEARLQKEPKTVHDAADGIEKLLGKVRQHFSFGR